MIDRNRAGWRGGVERLLYLRGDQRACFYCGESYWGLVLQFDHVTPTSHSGPDTVDNLVFACRACNTEKSSWPGWLYVLRETGILERIRDRRLDTLRAERWRYPLAPHGERAVTQPEPLEAPA